MKLKSLIGRIALSRNPGNWIASAIFQGIFMTNEKAFKRFLWGLLIASMIIHLLGCAPVKEIETIEIYQGGCVYEQMDTVISGQTYFIYNKSK